MVGLFAIGVVVSVRFHVVKAEYQLRYSNNLKWPPKKHFGIFKIVFFAFTTSGRDIFFN